MKLITVGVVAALALSSVGVANAVPTLTNGDFSMTSPTQTTPKQFGANSGNVSGCGAWGGQFVSGWTGGTGYGIWYPSVSDATTVAANTQYGCANTQRLAMSVNNTGMPTGVNTFVGLDGQSGIQFSIQQKVNGLTTGQKYTVNFYWATTQEQSRVGQTYDKLQVSLGGQTINTSTITIPTQGFSGWMHESFTFTAGSNPLLSFLSVGGPTVPGGLPPFALLTGVSVTQVVPEPPELALFGLGLLGLGVLTVVARRRALRRNDVEGDSDIG